MRKDEREEVKSAAEWAWQSRFAPVDVADDEEDEWTEDLLPVAGDDECSDGDLDDIAPDELPF